MEPKWRVGRLLFVVGAESKRSCANNRPLAAMPKLGQHLATNGGGRLAADLERREPEPPDSGSRFDGSGAFECHRLI